MEIKIKYYNDYCLESTEDNPRYTPYSGVSKTNTNSYSSPNDIARVYIKNIMDKDKFIFEYNNNRYNIEVEVNSSNIDHSISAEFRITQIPTIYEFTKHYTELIHFEEYKSVFDNSIFKNKDRCIDPKHYYKFSDAKNIDSANKHLNMFFKCIDRYISKELKIFYSNIRSELKNKEKDDLEKKIKSKEESLTIFKN